jgi:glycosyltransferase involved in cell wall biosynthesis
MKVVVFANRMPDLCGAFLHDIDLSIELQNRGHSVVFLIIQPLAEGVNGGTYRGFRYMHFTAGGTYLDSSDIWMCPHSPCLPEVRAINRRGYNRPIVGTCHFDGNYNAIRRNINGTWNEFLLFINRTMENNYKTRIRPWPSIISRTEVIRPIMHRNKIVIDEPFSGDCITLVNANINKGVRQFMEIAKNMPDRNFLAVRPYYGELGSPTDSPSNIEWVAFDDDIRNILKRTRVLLVPSYYESFGRIAVEAMINGIPVLYSKPALKPTYEGGSTEGMREWLGDAGIEADRENPMEWVSKIIELDDVEVYASRSQKVRSHIDGMNLFTEASRIANLVESFSRENPVSVRSTTAARQPEESRPQEVARPREPPRDQAVNVGLANGRLRIRR